MNPKPKLKLYYLNLNNMKVDPEGRKNISNINNVPISQIQQMQNKIDELTKEIRDLNDKNQLLLVELTILREEQRVVEDHKGEREYDAPPYQEEDAALAGDACDVTFHS